MAAKTITEAIKISLAVGPLTQIEERLLNNLRDFFAHEVMKYENRQQLGIAPPGIQGFFDHVFRDAQERRNE